MIKKIGLSKKSNIKYGISPKEDIKIGDDITHYFDELFMIYSSYDLKNTIKTFKALKADNSYFIIKFQEQFSPFKITCLGLIEENKIDKILLLL
jgi:hypothetical protein